MKLTRAISIILSITCLGKINIYSQTSSILAKGPHAAYNCDTLTYEFTLENLCENEVLELNLNYEFSYVQNSFNTKADLRSESLYIDLKDYGGCQFISGTVSLIPMCLTPIEPITLRYNTSSCSPSSGYLKTQTVTEALFLKFGPYEYDNHNKVLSKEIEVINLGSQTIDQLEIQPDIKGNFVQLQTTSAGSISPNGSILLSTDDLLEAGASNGVLNKSESISLFLEYQLTTCDVQPISYAIKNLCANYCDYQTVYIDDIIKRPDQIIVQSDDAQFNLNYCAPNWQTISIKNEENQVISADLSDIFNLVIHVDKPIFTSNNHFRCIVSSMLIGNQIYNPIIQNGSEFQYNFQQITIDPDGPGGLSDLDGDGIYDDLLNGDSIIVQLEYSLDENCVDDAYTLQAASGHIYTSYTDVCNHPERSADESITLGESYSFGSQVKNIKRDNRNLKYFEKDEIVEYVNTINLSKNYSNICPNDAQLTIVVPPNLELLDEGHYLIQNRKDSIPLDLIIVDDTIRIPLINIHFLKLHSFYKAICNEDDNSMMTQEELCSTCNSSLLYPIEAYIEVRCDLSVDCELPSYQRKLTNGPFKTACTSSEFFDSKLKVDSIIVRRINKGWTDANRTSKFNSSNSSNEIYFFDSDTLSSEYYFELACPEDIDTIEISLKWLQNNSNTTLDLLKSRLIQTETGQQVDMIMHTRDIRGNIELTIDNDDLLSSGFWTWQLVGVVRMNVQFTNNLSYAHHPIQFTTIEKGNNCLRVVDKRQISTWYSEHWKEQFFEPFQANLSLIPNFQAQRVINIGPRLAGNFASQSFTSKPEYRETPTIKKIKYSVPKGYVIANSAYTTESYALDHNISLDAIFGYDLKKESYSESITNASEIVDDNLYTHYYFEVETDLLLAPHRSVVIGSAMIQSVCPPEDPNIPLIIEGILMYKDYAGGSLSTIEYPFREEMVLEFNNYNLKVEDDFQIVEKGENLRWFVENQSFRINGFPILFNQFGNDLGALSEKYTVKINLSGINIDSIEILDPTEMPLLPSEFIIENNGQTWSISDPNNFFYQEPNFIIYSSNHDCGYDTLYVSYTANNDIFGEFLCEDNLWKDTLISFNPVGLPNIEMLNAPQFVEPCQEAIWNFRLDNLGQGLLLDPILIIQSNVIDFLDVETINEIDARELPKNYLDDQTIAIELGNIINQLNGIADATAPNEARIIIGLNSECINTDEIELNLSSRSKNICDKVVESNSLITPLIPVLSDSYNNELNVNLTILDECSNVIQYQITGQSDQLGESEDIQMNVTIDRGSEYINGSSQSNIGFDDDPSIIVRDEQLVLTWQVDKSLVKSDSLQLSFKVNTECVNVCEPNHVSAKISALTNNQCQFECNNRRVLSYIDEKLYRQTPQFIFREIYTLITNQHADGSTELQLDVDIKQNNQLNYIPAINFLIYHDSNQNLLREENEPFIFKASYDREDYNFLDIEIREIISLEASQLCDLVMTVDIGDCNCYPLNHRIELDPVLGLNNAISYCDQSSLNLYGPDWSVCERLWIPNENLDLSDPLKPIYFIDSTITSDTLFVMSSCFGCSRMDTILLQKMDQFNGSIEIIYPNSCDPDSLPGAQLTIDQNIEDYEISWEGYTAVSTHLSNIIDDEISATVTSSSGCTFILRDSVYQNQFDQNWTILSSSSQPILGEFITLSLSDNHPKGEIFWQPDTLFDCIDCQSVSFMIKNNQNISVQINDQKGCTYTDSITLIPIIDIDVYIPNGFSPNNDQINDHFYPSFNIEEIIIRKWSIYDRWGNRVYESIDETQLDKLKWDGKVNGKQAQEGVYFYRLQIETLQTQDKFSFKGNLTLIR